MHPKLLKKPMTCGEDGQRKENIINGAKTEIREERELEPLHKSLLLVYKAFLCNNIFVSRHAYICV